MTTLAGKTAIITGASRGIGQAIAHRLAKEGVNIVIAAKTVEPHPKLPGTIYTVAKEVEALGAKALPIACDVRNEEQVAEMVKACVETFGGIDFLINNASAISLTPTLDTAMKRFDLMFGVNVRATFSVSQACIPHLKKSKGHIITMSPPLDMNPKWFSPHLAYTMSKYGMSMCTLGLSDELKDSGVRVNSLWPRTTIATAAIANNFPAELLNASRKPDIVADAACMLLSNNKMETGCFYIDEKILRDAGVTDFKAYAVDPTIPLMSDLFIDSGVVA